LPNAVNVQLWMVATQGPKYRELFVVKEALPGTRCSSESLDARVQPFRDRNIWNAKKVPLWRIRPLWKSRTNRTTGAGIIIMPSEDAGVGSGIENDCVADIERGECVKLFQFRKDTFEDCEYELRWSPAAASYASDDPYRVVKKPPEHLEVVSGKDLPSILEMRQVFPGTVTNTITDANTNHQSPRSYL
jgi:hypothetical protein